MGEKLLKIFELADLLNKKQDKVYARIEYYADDRQKFIITLVSKKECIFHERFEVELNNNFLINWNCIITLLQNYIDDVSS